jgi:hypothetical protein
MGGITVNGTEKVIFIIVATAIQAILPYLGHATMVKVLKALIIPFALIFVAFAVFAGAHAHAIPAGPYGSGWQLYTAGLAFVFALSGLGWTECGNDYTRYVPRDAKKRTVVGWIFLGTAIPEILMMILGALAFTFLSGGGKWNAEAATAAWNGSNPFEALRHGPLPSWFLVIFMLFAIVQLFGINSLDLYSSGVSIQAMGPKIKRYQAVLLDSVIAGSLTIYATFQSTFSLYMKEFVGVIIVWIAPCFAIFVVDWLLRRQRYSASDLQKDDASSLYWANGGINWNAFIAFVLGVIAATTAFSKAPPPVNFPLHWMTPFSNAHGAFYCDGSAKAACGPAGWFGGADLSIFFGIITAGVLYFVLEKITGTVAKQNAKLGN